MNIIDQIISSYSNNKSLYIGEKVTITEHMIQTAMLAEKNNWFGKKREWWDFRKNLWTSSKIRVDLSF